MKIKFLLIVAILSWNIASLGAQEESPFGKKIVDIQFQGLVNVKPNDLTGITRPFKGKELNQALVYELQEKLLSSGFFLSIGDISVNDTLTTAQGVVLVVEIDKEKPVINQVRISGNKKFKARDLLGKSGLGKGKPFDLALLSSAELAIKSTYTEAGYLQSSVQIDYKELENATIDVNIRITEGLPQVVREIEFQGIQKLTEGKGNEDKATQMRKLSISQKTRGIIQKGLYQEELIPEDSQRIELFYRNNGFLDAKVVQVYPVRTVSEEDGAIYIKLVYVIEEGEQFLYGGVTLKGNNIYADEELYPFFNYDPATGTSPHKVPGLNVGEVFNYTSFMQAFVNGLQALYSAKGYVFNEYEPVEKREGNLVFYDISITEHDRAHVNKILISGNKKTKEHVISREIPFEEGEVYSQAKMMRAYNNLMATGYFDSVVPSVEQSEGGSIPGLVDVSIDVEEGRTIELQFGVSLSAGGDGFPISGVLSFGDRNFLGYGYELKANLSANTDEQKIGLSFYNPRFLNSKFGFGFNINYRHARQSTTQDILFPIFDKEDIPDPYTGAYVYTKGDKAGTYFEGEPTEEQIKDLGLMRDYLYFLNDSNYGFKYNSHEIGLGLTSGYVLPLPDKVPGYLRFNAGFDVGWNYIKYDANVNRPAYADVRRGLNRWLFNDGFLAKVAWDARNNPSAPTSGFILSEELYFAGGIFGGNRTYLKTKSRFDYYFEFPAIRFSAKEDGWKMQWDLKVHTAFTSISNQFGFRMVDAYNYYPQLDGMFFGRGWSDMQPTGQYMWENTVEFRLPLVSRILWWDTFIDMNMLWYNKTDLLTPSEWKDNFYGALGTGFRVAIPSLPISIYLIKRFAINPDGSVNWNPGTAPTFKKAGLDIAITISADMY